MSNRIMKAKTVTFSILDMSLIFSLWGKGKLDRSGVRAAVEINDIFESVLAANGELLGKAARGGEDQGASMDALIEKTETLTLSQSAFDSLESAVKSHDGWTCRGARQLLRIEGAFSDAVDTDLEPKKVEE